ncbi:MAG: hypothetical protein WD116_01250 [Chloroflexota bacterium]
MADAPPARPRWILHPALLAAAFVLEVALANKVEPAGFARALGIAILAGIGLTLAAWGITRDRCIGGLVATTLVLATISIIPLYFAWSALQSAFGPTPALATFGVVLFLSIALPAVQRVRVQRGASPMRGPATSVLNRFAAVLVVVVVAFHAGPDLPGAVANALGPRETVTVAPVSDLPDMYVLLLDGYPRADVLERRFGIDNSAFLAELGDLGFDVATDSHSNYDFTQLTMASMFQMRHLEDVDGLRALIGVPGGHVNALRNALIDSPGFATLEAAGYQIVVTQPGYDHVALRGVADRVLEHGEMNDLERDVLKRTWLLDPLGALMPTFFTGPPRDRVVHAFDDLSEVVQDGSAKPVFAWVHVPAPHLPLVLDADGRALELDPRRFDGYDASGFGMTDAEFAAAYADEITYLNARVIGAARALSSALGRPDPVIVIMSDHGYATAVADGPARLSNLFAAYTPRAPGLLADARTPVNLMAILFNRFLGTEFPLSADRYFLSPSITEVLELTEVHVPDPAADS